MSNDKYLRSPEVQQITGISGPTIYRLEKEDSFPSRRKIGKRAVAWLESEILQWLQTRSKSLSVDGEGLIGSV